jgi:general stress protein 26
MQTPQNDVLRNEAVTRLREIIRGIPTAMLTTVDETGEIRSRPMQSLDTEFDGSLYFFTNDPSPKVEEVATERHVNVIYADVEHKRYVSVSGTARTENDHARMATLWNDRLKEWFPKGLQEPNLALLRVTVTKAEYWDQPNSIAKDFAGNVAAVLTGRQYDPGTHQKLEL